MHRSAGTRAVVSTPPAIGGPVRRTSTSVRRVPTSPSVALAKFTGKPPKPLNPENGVEEPKVLAVIDEPACIGCKLCIKACPVDCIVGAGKAHAPR